VVKARGEFTRHTDEVFVVLGGMLTICHDDEEVTLGPGQLCVVPRGHLPPAVSESGAEVMLVEPSATVSTGDTPGGLTAHRRMA